MIVIVNEKAIREKAKQEERARIVTELALEGHNLKGAQRVGFFKAAQFIANLGPDNHPASPWTKTP